MPTNKNAQLRYAVLDRCFSDFGHEYSIDDLLKAVVREIGRNGDACSVRQLREDIRFMRDKPYNAPIKTYPSFGSRKSYYRYAQKGFSIFNNELSVDEVRRLRTTLEMISRYRGLPHYEWLEEAICQMESNFGIKPNVEKVVSFQQNDQLKGLEFLSRIIDAAINHQPLRIRYQPHRGDLITSVLHPYYVKQYNSRWFLFGYDEAKQKIANRALDRIKYVLDEKVPFHPNTSIDFEHYFDDVVGVTVPREDVPKEIIVLRFTEPRFPYVTSKPIHKSQKTISKQECIISIEVKPTRELEQQILSFGPDVEVLSPETFRMQIAKKIEEAMQKYTS